MNNIEYSRQGTPVYDTLEAQKEKYNLSQAYEKPKSLSSKEAMQQLYKNQLDNIIVEKQKQKQLERLKQENEKKEFNERAEQGKEAEKMKQISYKNYYNMLMNNQVQNQETYISPFSKRDAMKDTLITQGVEDERKKFQLYQMDLKKKEQEKRNSYKNELLTQIEERRKKEYMERHEEIKEKEHFQKNTKLPDEIQRYEKEKKKEEYEKYREDLDKLRDGRQYRSQSQSETGLNKIPQGSHNILTNPLPYNIQNPYILKEMGIPKNQSYLAMKGIENLKLS